MHHTYLILYMIFIRYLDSCFIRLVHAPYLPDTDILAVPHCPWNFVIAAYLDEQHAIKVRCFEESRTLAYSLGYLKRETLFLRSISIFVAREELHFFVALQRSTQFTSPSFPCLVDNLLPRLRASCSLCSPVRQRWRSSPHSASFPARSFPPTGSLTGKLGPCDGRAMLKADTVVEWLRATASGELELVEDERREDEEASFAHSVWGRGGRDR
jgi:hypothetical protein